MRHFPSIIEVAASKVKTNCNPSEYVINIHDFEAPQ